MEGKDFSSLMYPIGIMITPGEGGGLGGVVEWASPCPLPVQPAQIPPSLFFPSDLDLEMSFRELLRREILGGFPS